MISDTVHVTIRETITYQRDFTRPELARLLAESLDDIEDAELIARVSGNPAVEEALQHYGDVQLESWQVTAGDDPGTDEPDPRPRATTPAATTATHGHTSAVVFGRDLGAGHILLGETGGRCAVYESAASSAMPGLMCVETEHGPLYLDPDHDYPVLVGA